MAHTTLKSSELRRQIAPLSPAQISFKHVPRKNSEVDRWEDAMSKLVLVSDPRLSMYLRMYVRIHVYVRICMCMYKGVYLYVHACVRACLLACLID